MILEAAPLQVRPGQSAEFEAAFLKAQAIISSMPGYLSHELQRCVERSDEYLLLVRWRSLADHETGFRQSPQYLEWKSLLHHFYDPFPVVSHYQRVPGADGGTGNQTLGSGSLTGFSVNQAADSTTDRSQPSKGHP